MLKQWINQIQALCQPSQVHFCDGSEEEYQTLCQKLVEVRTFIPLNPKLRPGSYLARSHPDDVARIEERTFICSRDPEDAGPTNNWRDPKEMHDHLDQLFTGCMQGRTMYVIPFCMGPLGSAQSRLGIQITDSAYVVVNMRIMTRMGNKVWDLLQNQEFVPCVHSVGVPLKEGQKDTPWPCDPKNRCIVQFPEEKQIWSYGSGYGGNALLGKKCFALRIASVMAREEMWMAEHMLIMKVTNPKGKYKYFTAAFPSACGKTNLAMLTSTLPGWSVECVGDDIAWMRQKEDGRIYAINPESGFFGVAPGTSLESNPNAMKTIEKNTIFTNVALTKDKDVWWEGMTDDPPEELIDWQGKPWTPSSSTPAAHPNARFTALASQCPVMDPKWEDPDGVPISAMIFGGRRSHTMPLVFEAFNWQHAVFVGASVSSEMTAAAKGTVGELRHDPFAMLPFCGYHMGDYFAHWLEIGHQIEPHLRPKIFHVNWFKKSEKKEFLWPGFGENIRIVKWMFERCDEQAEKKEAPIGYLPTDKSLDLSNLNISEGELKELFAMEPMSFLKELEELEAFFFIFGDKLPREIREELDALKNRVLQ